MRNDEDANLFFFLALMTPSQACDLADTFVKWFYDLLNNVVSSGNAQNFSPDHFWADASAKIALLSAPEASELVTVDNNGREVCSAIKGNLNLQ